MRPSSLYQAKIDAQKLEADAAQQALLPVLDAAFEALLQPPKKSLFKRHKPMGGGIYLWGDVGRGKTMLMDVFFHALPETLYKQRIHFHAFMLDVHKNLKELRADNAAHNFLGEVAATIATKTRVLCFDEFHVTDIADAMILGPLFKALFDEGVFIFATSNWQPEDLYKNGLQRARFLPFIDVVKTRMQVLKLESAIDHRLKTLTANGVYFTDGGLKLKWIFDHLALGFAEDKTIKAGERVIQAVALSADVGWFTFETLCMEPRGAVDYLAVAENCGTVLIENVPPLSDARPDFAKRFMTLIDVLYDAKRVVIIGAATPIQDLYVGERLAFEFQRTKSRLIEMQHPDWYSARLNAQ